VQSPPTLIGGLAVALVLLFGSIGFISALAVIVVG
jgi:hypothetical protein